MARSEAVVNQRDCRLMKPCFNIDFSTASLQELAARVADEDPAIDEDVRLIVTANVAHVVELARNNDLRAAYRSAWVRTVDGTPIYLYAKLRGLPIRERVTGADLLPAVLGRLDPRRHRPFLVCSTSTGADKAIARLRQLGFASDAVGTHVPPFQFETDPHESETLRRAILNHKTTHAFFGVGMPKSEVWLNRHRHDLKGMYAMAVGAGLDFFAGTVRRAPKFVQHLGMEWFWRLAREPRRLSRRYMVESWILFFEIYKDLARSDV